MTNDDALADATEIAIEAGERLRGYFRRPLRSRAKTPTSFVTEADETTERLIRERLAERFPGESVLGEEFGFDGDADRAWWAVDPLDGTTNFIAGVPIFCVAMARFEGGQPTLAVIHDPNTGETYTAAHGHGAWLDGDPLAIDGADPGALTMVSIRHGVVRRAPDLVRQLGPGKLRSFGSVCLELAWTAAGRLHGVFGRQVHLWDVAAGGLMIAEAGGAVESRGGPLFPLRESPATFVDLEMPVIAGTAAVVERLRPALD